MPDPLPLGHQDGEVRVPLRDLPAVYCHRVGRNQCQAASGCRGPGGRAWPTSARPLRSCAGYLVAVQGRAHRRIPISQRSALRDLGGGVFSCRSTTLSQPFVQVAAAATETTQPDKERNSCVQLTALRLTALPLPGRLSLAEQWQRAGWLPPETGAAASRGGSVVQGCQRTHQAPEAAQS